MHCEQFIYGLTDGGYRPVKSRGVDPMLTEEMWRVLTHLSDDSTMLWPGHPPVNEPIVTCTRVMQTKDQYKRDGTWSHTILFYVKDYLTLHPPQPHLTPYFHSADAPQPSKLKPLTVEI